MFLLVLTERKKETKRGGGGGREKTGKAGRSRKRIGEWIDTVHVCHAVL